MKLPARIVIAAWLITAAASFAQAPPATDIHLLAIDATSATPTVGPPRAVTDRDGYDNQPQFLPDGRSLVYTSIRGEQADIRRFVIASGEDTAVTETPESEYSPTPIPGDDNGLSVIRVEEDGTQRLWRMPMGDGTPSLLLEHIAPVGYHTWIDEHHVGLFILGPPARLHVATVDSAPVDALSKNGKGLGTDIGRGLGIRPGTGTLTYVVRRGDEDVRIAEVVPIGAEPEPQSLARARGGREDFAWAPDGSLWMGDGSVLYRIRPQTESDWVAVADLAEHGLDDLTRLAFSPDGKWLAVVASRPAAAPTP